MFANYLSVTLRHFSRHIGYTLINVGGLGVCLGCCLVIFVFIKNEWSVDRHHPEADNLFRITTSMRVSENAVPVLPPGLLGPTLVESLPGVVNQVRIRCMDEPVLIKRGQDRFHQSGVCYSEPALFEIFDIPLVLGAPEAALQEPGTIVLSRKLASQYFGDQNPIGEVIELNGSRVYEVTGVLENEQRPSHLSFGLLASFASLTAIDPSIESWADGGANAYVKLSSDYDNTELQSHLDASLSTYMGYFAEGITAEVKPVADMYFSSVPANSGELRGNIQYVYLFALFAVLLITISCINYANLATARALNRAREIGVRKTMGASQKQLVIQFLGESNVLSFLALIAAFLLALLALPSFSTLIGRDLHVHDLFSPLSILGALILCGTVALFAGIYPAFYLSAFDPSQVLKGKAGSVKATNFLRKSLLVVQFTLSMGLVASSIVLWNQLQFMRSSNLGFDKEHVVLITPTEELKTQYSAFKRDLLALPGVVKVSTAPIPGHDFVVLSSHRVEGYTDNSVDTPYIETFDVDYDFVELLDVDIKAGRNFDPAKRGDAQGSILINEAAVRFFGWGNPEDAIGRKVSKPVRREGALEWENYQVIGVLEDFQSWTMRKALTPIFLYLTTDEVKWWGKVIVKIRPDDVPGTLGKLGEVWAEFAPDRVFAFTFLDQEIDRFYKDDKDMCSTHIYV